MTTKQPNKRTFTGVVVSDKMNKTITVAVVKTKMHPKYKKQYQVSSKFKVHDEKEEASIGDTVEIVETRPLSRTKRWKLAAILTKAA